MPARRIEGDVMDRVELLAIRNSRWSPTQIHQEVNRDSDPERVSLRTVQRVVSAIRADQSGPWSLVEAAPEEAAVVLPVLRWTIEQGHPRPTQSVATWVTLIWRAFPELDVGSVYELALAAAAGGAPRDRAEVLMAFTPWRDEGDALARAYGRGLVDDDVIRWAGIERKAYTERRRAEEAGETGPEDPVVRLRNALSRKERGK